MGAEQMLANTNDRSSPQVEVVLLKEQPGDAVVVGLYIQFRLGPLPVKFFISTLV